MRPCTNSGMRKRSVPTRKLGSRIIHRHEFQRVSKGVNMSEPLSFSQTWLLRTFMSLAEANRLEYERHEKFPSVKVSSRRADEVQMFFYLYTINYLPFITCQIEMLQN